MARDVQIGVQGVQDNHGEFGAKVVEFAFTPSAIETHGPGDVFGKGLAVVAFADQDVTDEASGVDVIDAAAGLATGGGQAEEYFADVAELCAVVPGLGSIDLGMMAFGAVVEASDVLHLFGGIEIQDALARVANDGLLAGADFVIGLRAKHDLARHAFVIADFRKAAAAEFGNSLVVAQQVLVNPGAEPVALARSIRSAAFRLPR